MPITNSRRGILEVTVTNPKPRGAEIPEHICDEHQRDLCPRGPSGSGQHFPTTHRDAMRGPKRPPPSSRKLELFPGISAHCRWI
mgnify:CR=1 FL=1